MKSTRKNRLLQASLAFSVSTTGSMLSASSTKVPFGKNMKCEGGACVTSESVKDTWLRFVRDAEQRSIDIRVIEGVTGDSYNLTYEELDNKIRNRSWDGKTINSIFHRFQMVPGEGLEVTIKDVDFDNVVNAKIIDPEDLPPVRVKSCGKKEKVGSPLRFEVEPLPHTKKTSDNQDPQTPTHTDGASDVGSDPKELIKIPFDYKKYQSTRNAVIPDEDASHLLSSGPKTLASAVSRDESTTQIPSRWNTQYSSPSSRWKTDSSDIPQTQPETDTSKSENKPAPSGWQRHRSTSTTSWGKTTTPTVEEEQPSAQDKTSPSAPGSRWGTKDTSPKNSWGKSEEKSTEQNTSSRPTSRWGTKDTSPKNSWGKSEEKDTEQNTSSRPTSRWGNKDTSPKNSWGKSKEETEQTTSSRPTSRWGNKDSSPKDSWGKSEEKDTEQTTSSRPTSRWGNKDSSPKNSWGKSKEETEQATSSRPTSRWENQSPKTEPSWSTKNPSSDDKTAETWPSKTDEYPKKWAENDKDDGTKPAKTDEKTDQADPQLPEWSTNDWPTENENSTENDVDLSTISEVVAFDNTPINLELDSDECSAEVSVEDVAIQSRVASVSLTGAGSGESWELPTIEYIYGDLSIRDTLFSHLRFPKLKAVYGSIHIKGNKNLQTVTFDQLEFANNIYIGSSMTQSDPNLPNLDVCFRQPLQSDGIQLVVSGGDTEIPTGMITKAVHKSSGTPAVLDFDQVAFPVKTDLIPLDKLDIDVSQDGPRFDRVKPAGESSSDKPNDCHSHLFIN